ncbi:xylulokinase [Polycladidibacter stylochi]|uniref:xylulokinase n=1 Tax=Polycladidibacter stylochi TaxID=1807766 RepID=UPI00082DA684|nr:FGGY family carbohydrate kinase [Pseudovibrio stylochi]
MSYFLTFDIGTTSLKAVLFDSDLNIAGQAKQEYETLYPRLGWAEHEASYWRAAMGTCIQELLHGCALKASQIAGIGIAGMSSMLLPVDANGTPLRPGLIWLDRRAQRQSDYIKENFENRQIEINGNRSDPSNFGPKAMWLRDNEPEIYAKAAYLLHCNAYLVHQLTGEFTMDRSQAGLSQICDGTTGEYSEELIDLCGLDASKLPAIVEPSAVAGYVTKAAAEEFGLTEGTPVIAGAMDNVAATVGLGLQNEGDAYIAAGTVINAGLLTKTPFESEGAKLGDALIYHSGVPGYWLVNGGVDYGGAGMLWFRNLLENTSFEELCKLADETAPAEHPMIFLPYMTGQRAPHWNDSLSGLMLGISPDSKRAHLARSFMESAAMGSRHVFSKLTNNIPTRATLTGGITNNPRWSAMFAEASGIELDIPTQAELGNLGLAVLIATAIGKFDNVKEGMNSLSAPQTLKPGTKTRSYYSDLFALFIKTYEDNLETMAGLTALRKNYEEV